MLTLDMIEEDDDVDPRQLGITFDSLVVLRQDSTPSSRLRRVSVHFAAPPPHAAIEAAALLDSGSEVNIVNQKVADQLIASGHQLEPSALPMRVASGDSLTAGGHFDLTASFDVDGQHKIQVRARFVLVPSCKEPVILGMPLCERTGLLALLLPAPPALSEFGPLEADMEIGLAPPAATPDGDSVRNAVERTIHPSCPNRVSWANALLDFEDVFAPLDFHGAQVDPVKIEFVPGAELPHARTRPLSPAMREVLRKELNALLAAGIIAPASRSRATSPIVLVKKADGAPRLCVDLSALNKWIVRDHSPLPYLESVFQGFGGCQWFATVDLQKAFMQVPLHDDSVPYMVFTTPLGDFEMRRLPIGMVNSAFIFQRLVEQVLGDLVRQHPDEEGGGVVAVFQDDISIGAPTPDRLLVLVLAVLERLGAVRLRAKLEKTMLCCPDIRILGQQVSRDGISMLPSRRQALLDIKPPKDKKSLKSFLGAAGYNRRFIPGFSMLTKPLSTLAAPGSRWVWTDVHQSAFDAIKAALAATPLLAFLEYDKDIYVMTDGSAMGVGSVLCQFDDHGNMLPVCFASYAFSDQETRWSTAEIEAYALVHAVKAFTPYIQGHHFFVLTDCKYLLALLRDDAPRWSSPKLMRYRLFLQNFDFTIRHVPGKTNFLPDMLSRALALTIDNVAMIERAHNAVVGHGGKAATLRKLDVLGLNWDTREEDVTAFIRSCSWCSKARSGGASLAAIAKTICVHQPFESVSVDMVGPFPEDASGNRYIHAFVDDFSRFVELVPCRDATAVDAAQAILTVVGRYGMPRVVNSDHGSNYCANIVKGMIDLLGGEQHLHLVARPASNGLIERSNQETLRHLRALVAELKRKDNWSLFLPMVQRIINASLHSAIDTTPARIMYGGAVDLDRMMLRPLPDDPPQQAVEMYIQDRLEMQKKLIAVSDQHQQKVLDARAAAGPLASAHLEEGEYVLVRSDRRSDKLAFRLLGPMVIAGSPRDDNIYPVQDLRTLNIHHFHLDRLVRYDATRTPFPAAIAGVDGDEYMVKAIIAHRRVRGRLEFLVEWADFDSSHNSWEPHKNVRGTSALGEYVQTLPELRL
jgi:hypothetical protein